MAASDIPKRLWAIQSPITWEVLAVKAAHRAEDACAAVANEAGWDCGPFYQSWLPGARAIENEGAAGMLYVADITGIVDAETVQSFGKAALAELAESADEGQYYVTRMSD